MTTDRRIALVAISDDHRSSLEAYLGRAGFDVHACGEIGVASAFGAIVWLDGSSAGDLVDRVRSWLRAGKPHRIVVVTARPAALRDLAAVHSERLVVLPAPAFGWDVVDALRAPRPRGA